MKKKNKLISLLALGAVLLGGGCSAISSTVPKEIQSQQQADKGIGGLTSSQYQKLSKLDYKAGKLPVIMVNHNNSTLKKSSWHTDKVIYQRLDRLNRTSGSNTAFLAKQNLANQARRQRQNIRPTGWHYPYRNGAQIYNRGHLIAYSLSGGINSFGRYVGSQVGDQNNPRNLFTQTAYSNQELQTEYEEQVRSALRSGQKVIYQATPIFRGNELMARGINLQARSTNGMLNFNVYIFNIQPGYQFDYRTGNVQKSR